MRPRGSFGEIAGALTKAAAHHGPGTVRELAARSCVAYSTARYTASRLVDAGALVVVWPGRPAVLDVPESEAEVPAAPAVADEALRLLHLLPAQAGPLSAEPCVE